MGEYDRAATAAVKEMEKAAAVLPRVVCTKCPAVATVHYWQLPEVDGGHAEIWMECHGEHVFGEILYRRSAGEFLFHQVRAFADDAIHNLFERAERAMQEHAEKAKLLQRFMKRETAPR